MAGFSTGGFAPGAFGGAAAGAVGARTAVQTGLYNPTGAGLQSQFFNPAHANAVDAATQRQQANAIIQGTPSFVAANAGVNRDLKQAAADRAAGIQGAYQQYGGPLPSGYEDTYGDLSPAFQQQVLNNNQYSDYGQNLHQYEQDFAGQRAAAGAAGWINPDAAGPQGQWGVRAADLRYNHGVLLDKLARSFLDAATSSITGYAGAVTKGSDTLTNATLASEQANMKNPAYTGLLGRKPSLRHYRIGF